MPVTIIRNPLTLALLASSTLCLSMLSGNPDEPTLLQQLQQSQIPKTETGVIEFLQQYPTYDGRDVVIAIFDTGVDPEAPGMQVTSTGERKLLNLYDASGAGDVDTRTQVQANEQGQLTGLTGRTLTLPEQLHQSEKTFHIGVKYGKELFRSAVWQRLMAYRGEHMHQRAQQQRASFLRTQPSTPEVGTGPDALESQALASEFDHYVDSLAKLDKGPFYDCVLWQDGEHWHAIVDTDEDGDLRDERVLRPFGIAGEWAQFPDPVAVNFAVQVFESGNRLSIVTTSGSHGTHVASIAAAHHPDNPALDGVAPGAKILSIRMGDVRIGGSSTYMGESLAVAIAAQYQVDIMNASWGGQSFHQDGSSWGVKLYDLLARKYGVSAFVSAGNDGPALSTLGSPGGEAQQVIGVGAHVSPEMGKLLYGVIGETRSTPFMFSSRGPARNGDMGVDILTPGAAIAALGRDSLESYSLYNGTSMAAPSAAGVGALLISAAKQEGLRTSPARLRYALMNSAQLLDSEAPFAQGAGLIHATGAWQHLRSHQAIDALDLNYQIEVSGNSYADGPGVYLRADASHFSGKRSVRMNLHPAFPDSLDTSSQYALNLFLKARTAPSWLYFPEGMQLTHGGKVIRPQIDFDLLNQQLGPTGAIHHHTLELELADAPEAGPLIRIPFTVVQSAPVAAQRLLPEQAFSLESSRSHTHFLTPPDGVRQLSLTVGRSSEPGVEKLFVMHALSLVAHEDIEHFENREYFTLKPGDTQTFEIPVRPGLPLELTLHQVWSYDEPTSLRWSGQWRSAIAEPQSLVLLDNGSPNRLMLESRFDSSFDLEALIDRAAFSLKPESTHMLPFDRRGTRPGGERDADDQPSFQLEQVAFLSLDAPLEVEFQTVQFATEFEAGGGIITAYDEEGFPVGTDLAPSDPDEKLKLPKGKNRLVRQFISPDIEVLERLKPLPFVFTAPIGKQSVALSVGLSGYSGGQTHSSVTLKPDRSEWLVMRMPDPLKSDNLPGVPNHYLGTLTIKEGDASVNSIDLVALRADSATPSKAESTSSAPSTAEALQVAVYDQQLAFLKQSRKDFSAAIQAERNSLLKELSRNSTDPRIWLEEVYSLAIDAELIDPWFAGADSHAFSHTPVSPPANKLRAFQRRIEQLIQDCEPAKVAEYLGAKPVMDDPDSVLGKAEAERLKQFQNLSQYLREAQLIAAHASLKLGDPAQARSAWNESRRWNQGESKSLDNLASRLEILLLWKEGYPAQALERVRSLREQSATDPLLKNWQHAIREELGWTLASDLESLYDQISTEHLDPA